MGGPRWKREVVPDHKFDFVDTRDFTDNGFVMRFREVFSALTPELQAYPFCNFRYLLIYVSVLISFLVYMSDIFTVVTMTTTSNWSNQIFNSCTSQDSGCVVIPFNVGKWVFLGCIGFSFLLLAYEARKAKKIIASRDISYAYTNLIANNYYSIRSYDHFCFFHNINNSTKKMDDFAFFIFFTFKSWKRVLLADGPRQVINALTLYSFYISHENQPGAFYDLNKYTNGSALITGLLFSTAFTVIVFIGSAVLLLAAGVLYIPLLCYIRGNLKEYCCHKVDKRIAEIVKRKNKERLAKAAILRKKEAAGDFTHLKNKKGELIHNPLPQPTLPKVNLDDLDDSASTFTKGPASSVRTGESDFYYNKQKAGYGDYPPPALPYHQSYPFPGYGQYAQSSGTLQDEPQHAGYYEEDYNNSQAHLTRAPSRSATALGDPEAAPYHNEQQQYGYAAHSRDYIDSQAHGGYAQQNHPTEQYHYSQNEVPEGDLAYADTSYYNENSARPDAQMHWPVGDHGHAM